MTAPRELNKAEDLMRRFILSVLPTIDSSWRGPTGETFSSNEMSEAFEMFANLPRSMPNLTPRAMDLQAENDQLKHRLRMIAVAIEGVK